MGTSCTALHLLRKTSQIAKLSFARVSTKLTKPVSSASSTGSLFAKRASTCGTALRRFVRRRSSLPCLRRAQVGDLRSRRLATHTLGLHFTTHQTSDPSTLLLALRTKFP